MRSIEVRLRISFIAECRTQSSQCPEKRERQAPRTVLGFATLPASFFTFLAISTATYLMLVELAKRRLFAKT